MSELGDSGAWQDQDVPPAEGRHPRPGMRTRGPLAYLRRIFTEPFRSDPELSLHLPVPLRERRRRAALLRLFLLSVAVLASVVVLLPALLLAAPRILIVTVGLDIALACIGLALLRLERPSLAAGVFIYGALGIGVVYLLGTPSGLDELVLLVFATLALLILIAGMVLPSVMIWPTAGLIVAVTIAGMLLLPISQTLMPDSSSPGFRYSALGLLVGIQSMAAVISWVSARSAGAGVRGATRALERERELAALKDQFIIAANHELRSPIMAMYGNIELLAMMKGQVDDKQRERMIARALQSGDAVLELLSNVLDAGFIEASAPRLTLRPVPLAQTVRSVLETFDPREIGAPGLPAGQADTKRPVRVDIAAELIVLADESRLRQILVNLVSNALKYSEPGSPIVVSTAIVPQSRPLLGRLRGPERLPTTPPDIQICVRDRGLGVPPRDASKLFNRFVRLERDIAGPVRGTGVGLYLCRLLTEAMGGRIWVESSGVPGEGSAFYFTLPAAPALPLATDAMGGRGAAE
jgi:signal transduction histidine kinase